MKYLEIKFSFLLCLILPLVLTGQKTFTFDYFKRAGTVDLRLFVIADGQKNEVTYDNNISLENQSDINQFIFEFSNLNIGLDQKTKRLKQGKDREEYFLYFPSDASSITSATESFKLEGISNDASLSDSKTDKANKSVEILYSYYNNSDRALNNNIQLSFRVESHEGKRLLKDEDKGSTSVKINIVVKPNYKHLEKLSLQNEENELFNAFVSSNNITQKNNLARQYLQKFKGLNLDRTDELNHFLKNINSHLHPEDLEANLFEKIVKFCHYEKELNRCSNYVTEYQDLVYDDPQNYKGKYLEQAYLHRLNLFSNKPNPNWITMCERFLEKFPHSSRVYMVQEYISEHKREMEKMRKPPPVVHAGIGRSLIKSSDKQELEPEIFIEEEIQELVREDFANIEEHEGKNGVTIRTGGHAKDGYVVEFISMVDQSLVYNPSFLGNNYSIKLAEAGDDGIASGKYKINVYTKTNRQHLHSYPFSYNATKVPAEIKYLLLVGSLYLCYLLYVKYIKI